MIKRITSFKMLLFLLFFSFPYTCSAYSIKPLKEVKIIKGSKTVHKIDFEFRVAILKPRKKFVHWLVYPDSLNNKRFIGSIYLRGNGRRQLTSITISVGGKKRKRIRYKPSPADRGKEILRFKDTGLTYIVKVDEKSYTGKTFNICVKGQAELLVRKETPNL